ncbi:tetratricopeptide repeat protein [Candidatus Magnetaquicoccus inordinatus]|uniref:tetratricopeptide repeat protein n=1 Tax=Candidatus Magnetaquicoccus inordinatus TaxID=2496818 RepID=UPI00187D40A4|nr:tetratricopeptide repeat protein [Candidatus Magnetaquicoccus inordinatus]
MSLIAALLGGCFAPGRNDAVDNSDSSSGTGQEQVLRAVAPSMPHQQHNDPFSVEVREGRAYYYYLLGQFLLRERNWHDAERALTEVAKADPTSAETRVMVAHLATQRGDLPKAIHYAEEAIALDGKDEKSRQLLAGLLTATKMYDKAALQYEEILKINPDQMTARLQLAQLYGRTNQIELAKKSLTPLFNKSSQAWKAHLALGRAYANIPDQEKAVLHFRKAHQLDPDKLETVLALGAALQELKRPKEAEAVYRSFLNSHPDSKEIHSRMGRLLLNQDDQEAALNEFQAISQMAPDSIPARLTSALILLSQRRFEEALQELRLAEATRSDDGRVAYYLGQVLESLDRFTEAEETYNRIQPTEPFYSDAQLRLSLLEAESGRREAGVNRLRSLLAAYPISNKKAADKLNNNSPADPKVRVTLLVALSVLLMQDEKYTEVYDVTTQGLAIDPDHNRLRFSRAIALDKLNRWSEAEQDLLHHLKLNPNDANALNYLGYTWTERNERLEEALKLLEKALALSPGDGFITDSVGWALFRLNRLEESLLRMREAVRLEPKDATITEHLGDVLHALGKMEEANNVWKKALELDPGNERLLKKVSANASSTTP